MKSRELHTTPVVVVSNYRIAPRSSGKYLHSFTPESTSTQYHFIANQEPLLEDGERYSFGYTIHNGVNWVDTSAIAKAESVDPDASFYVARLLGEELREVEARKSDERVTHAPQDGYYLGKKYAWRIYGMAIPRDVFDLYLEHIGHPQVPCVTEGSRSLAYLEDGLASAIEKLCSSLVRVANNRFSSPLVPQKKWFQVKGISAITDKK
ncbi:hypothetical protein VDG39_17775 [Xanthomonas campestris pv. raphani]|uniref:hypothetical protein n=1 Tax=Xanthomonas campestris TaxID=339 RepID=UPI002B222425|nr:hypothetical protein [Xanthomonas campestris]MEA9914534.1 hypothetical protein [Xanthomonas campestris pv. raphani]